MDLLAELEAKLAAMPAAEKAKLDKMLEPELSRGWLPNPGPQMDAYTSKADILLYGGAAGGGKSHLLLGTASLDHHRSLIVRRQTTELDGLIADSREIIGSRGTFRGAPDFDWTTTDGRSIKFGGLKEPDDWRKFAGRPRDLMGFDEAAEFLEEQVASLIGWLRTTVEGQRCRVILASNPPRGGEGEWLIRWFAPWLDPMYPNPAKDGELRWCIRVGDDIRWVDSTDPVQIGNETYTPQSRTFIPARLDDNPYLKGSGYRERLQGLPEPLRSQLLKGDFLAGREDHEYQVIPTSWVDAAQARWNDTGRNGQMLVVGCDVAQGGADQTSIAKLHAGAWFDKVESRPGVETPDGAAVALLIMTQRKDGALIGIDTTGGWGGAAKEHLKHHQGLDVTPIVFSAASTASDPESGLGFANLRAEMWWQFRQALNPALKEQVALPPGQRLKAQLTAPRWKLRGTDILIESKDDIKKRLKASTDEADAVIMAWKLRHKAASARIENALGNRMPGKAKLGHFALKSRVRR